MPEIVSRNDKIYKNIENFKDYEFTHCIAYEMQARSKGVVPEEISKQYCSNLKGYTFTELTLDNIYLSTRVTLQDYVFNIFPTLYEALFNEYRESHKKLSDDELKEKVLKEPILVKYIIEYYLKNEDTKFNEVFFRNDSGLIEKLSKEKLKEIIEDANFSHGLIPKFGYETILPDDFKFAVLYDINLALPEKELIAYISKIKKDFDRNKLIFDTSAEMLKSNYQAKKIGTQYENNLERYPEIKQFKKNGDEKDSINTSKIFKNAVKTADMFYIYDQAKKGFKQQDILYELRCTYNKFDQDRYNQYLITAKKYIDDKYYLNLIR